jgi:hypothetical protein
MLVISEVMFFLGDVIVSLYFEVSRSTVAAWSGTDRSAYIGFSHSDQHVLCAVVLTYWSAVRFLREQLCLQNTD